MDIYVAICKDDINSTTARTCRVLSLDSMSQKEAEKIVKEIHPARNWAVFPSNIFEIN